MSNRAYEKTRHFGRIVVQIMTQNFQESWTLHLLPQISIARNHHCLAAIGFEWIFGTINFGFATRNYINGLKEREEIVIKNANKLGITPKQQRLRWDW